MVNEGLHQNLSSWKPPIFTAFLKKMYFHKVLHDFEVKNCF